MARIFTSNQVNHVYVVKDVKSTKAEVTTVGDIFVDDDAEGNLFFTYMGPGGLVRSDIIENIMYAKRATAASMRKNLKNAVITFAIDPIAGADYTLNIEMQNPMGISPDNTYIQNVAARCFARDFVGVSDATKAAAAKSAVIARLADNLLKNFSRLDTKLFNVYPTLAPIGEFVSTGSYSKGDMATYQGDIYVNKTGTATMNATNWVAFDYNPDAYDSTLTTGYAVGTIVKEDGVIYVNKTAISSGSAAGDFDSTKWVALAAVPSTNDIDSSLSYTGIILEELPSEWILGLKQDKPLVYDVTSDYILNATSNTSFEEDYWASVVYTNGQVLKNGHAMADLEYFAMGERADQYRMSGWPNYIPTTYVIGNNPDAEYDVISIHYAYVGSNEAVQKSEKEITFICKTSETSDLKSAINTIKSSLIP